MNSARDEMDQFMSLWAEAQNQFQPVKKAAPAGKKPVPKKKPNSYYGMQNMHENDDIAPEEEAHWRDVYFRSLEIDTDELLQENGGEEDDIDAQCLAGMMSLQEAKAAKRAAAEKKAQKKSSKKKTEDRRKPQEDDAPDYEEDEDGFGKDMAKKLGDTTFTPNPVHFASVGKDSALRVTPNFTDGDVLRKLSSLRTLLHDLESEALGTDIRGGDPKAILIKIKSARRQCESLSQQLIPSPDKDVS